MTTRAKLPTIKEVSAILRRIKPKIGDEYRDEDETVPGIDITLGWSDETGDWAVQTGDNSFTGSAYGYPHWGVGRLYRRTDTRAMARDLIDQVAELAAQ